MNDSFGMESDEELFNDSNFGWEDKIVKTEYLQNKPSDSSESEADVPESKPEITKTKPIEDYNSVKSKQVTSEKEISEDQFLSDANDFFIIQCPKMVKLQDLQNGSLNFSKLSGLLNDGTGFQLNPIPISSSLKIVPCCLPGSSVPALIEIAGEYTLTATDEDESEDVNDISCSLISNVNSVQFPTNIKERNSLLGSEYKARELSNNTESSLEIIKKKKRKKDSDSSFLEVSLEESQVIDYRIAKSEKKKKRKSELSFEIFTPKSEVEENNENEYKLHKKVKKHKKKSQEM